jgi:hypothetical protein
MSLNLLEELSHGAAEAEREIVHEARFNRAVGHGVRRQALGKDF